MTITIRLHRHHLRYVPALVATIVALVCLQWWVTVAALVAIAVAYLATAMLLAAVDIGLSRYRARRHERQLEQSADAHPAGAYRGGIAVISEARRIARQEQRQHA